MITDFNEHEPQNNQEETQGVENRAECPLTKEQFCNLLRICHSVDSEVENLYNATKGALNLRDNINIVRMIDWLTDVMHDRTNTWIDYFVFELDFGEKWHAGCIIDDTGADVPLQTPEDLYVLLCENYPLFV